ncbi:helix-turn-helix domain-containing protein [uncultured Ruegeria sp.]|uniref:helix-turn-helix domain-containing protein n=1 Tax=uncultured Ruegeria sp. TaxID=259304 RepID=UPI00345BE3A5
MTLEPLQIKCVAREAGTSIRQLERKFVTTTGFTPKAYYLEERLEQVHAIVRFTNLTLPEVALCRGIGSYATLSHNHKQRYGRTPACECAQMYPLEVRSLMRRRRLRPFVRFQ